MKTDYKQIRTNEEINLLIEKGNATLNELATLNIRKSMLQRQQRRRGGS